jgi:hypothetical protein
VHFTGKEGSITLNLRCTIALHKTWNSSWKIEHMHISSRSSNDD